MSAIGTKRTYGARYLMSAFGATADILFLNFERKQKDRLAEVSPKSDEVFWSGSKLITGLAATL
jgi:hypothetical protein